MNEPVTKGYGDNTVEVSIFQCIKNQNQRCSIKKLFLPKNFVIFTGKHSVNKVAGLQGCNFIKRTLQGRCYPVNITKFLRTPILKNI